MTTICVDDCGDERLRPYTSLTNHQLRSVLDPANAQVIVESEIAIRVALERGLRPLSFLLSEARVRSMADVLSKVGDEVPIFVTDVETSREICGYAVTRGALSAMVRPTLPTLEELLRDARRVVVIEGVTDTANVGAIFRNAAALGADAVVCAPTVADPLSRRAVRVSMGNVFAVPWTMCPRPWPESLMGPLSDLGFARCALALAEDAIRLDDERLKRCERMALFFGSEGYGLTRKVIDSCDHVAIIPMAPGVDSLNVAATSAVALWELFCRR